MSAAVTQWPTRYPGRPYLWVLDIATERPSPRCVAHHARTNRLGVCDECVSEWRATLGADPDSWKECRVCGYPLHPTVEAEGYDTCPACDDKYATPQPREVAHA